MKHLFTILSAFSTLSLLSCEDPEKGAETLDKSAKAPKGGGGGGGGKSDGKNADWSGHDSLASVLYDLRDIKKDEELVCKALKASPADMKVNLTQPFNYDQLLQLLTWSTKNEFKKGKKNLTFSGDMKWKAEIVEALVAIFRKGCATSQVPKEFVLIMKEIVKIYLNSVPPKKDGKKGGAKGRAAGGAGGGEQKWKKQLEMLKSCAINSAPLVLEIIGGGDEINALVLPTEEDYYVPFDYPGQFDYYGGGISRGGSAGNVTTSGNGTKSGNDTASGNVTFVDEGFGAMSGVKVSIPPPPDTIDVVVNLDFVVDTLWWFYSFAFGTCYPTMKNKPTDSSELMSYFNEDFLQDLVSRWVEGGAGVMAYGPLFGEMDLLRAVSTMRTCVTAAYLQSGITERELLRPIEAY